MNIDISNMNLVLIFAGFMAGAIVYFWKIRGQQINTIASVVTVIGVLGTFVGIAIGLYNFDTSNIEESVPKLLDGLKIAFATSILGVFLSIILKCYALYERKRQAGREKTYSGATIDDLAGLLRDILAVEQEEGNETRDTLRAIERSLTGEGDSTVLTQLQKLRTTISDKQDDLIRSFNEFAARMAENNTNALIEALEGVMRDFNAIINEQLGDNFRQLNEAVGKLNDWQKQYHQQMEELAAEFRIAAESIETSRQSLEVITERSNTISSAAEKLDPILQALQHQIQQLNNHLTAFSTLADNAGNAFPIIEGRLNQLTDNFSTVVQTTIDNSHASMDRQQQALQDLTGQIEDLIQSTHQRLEESLQTQSRQLSTETERIFRAGGDHMTEQIRLLDTALQEELTKALESLGNQLVSLSRQFVNDYSPLTEKLREVVQMAKGMPQRRQHQ